MDSRSVIFLQVMAAIAIVGVLAFLVFLIGRGLAKSKSGPAGAGLSGAGLSGVGLSNVELSGANRWYQYLLAAALLLVVAIVGIWQFSTDGLLGQAADWRADGRAITFFVIMLVVAGLGLIGFLIYMIAQSSRQGIPYPEAASISVPSAPIAATPTPDSQPTPAGLRVLGLLALLFTFLLLNWIYLDDGTQYSLVLRLIYPAALAVALVLLFDKASRGWNIKDTSANVREWLLCDAMTFLLILSFVNLLEIDGMAAVVDGDAAGAEEGKDGAVQAYNSMFWDVLYVALFFLVFWILDRTLTRLRFLLAHAYFMALPILLLIWRAVQGVAIPVEISWWSTIWPFFFLAMIGFVMEIIVMLIQGSEGKQTLGAVKDAIFVAVYGILLIIAVPEADL